jgi:predicted RNase H-like HicB family nuclease
MRRKTMEYAVVIEQGENSYGAYVPDLPGCVAVADSTEEVRALIRDAIEMHIEDLREQHQPVPPPLARVELVRVAA